MDDLTFEIINKYGEVNLTCPKCNINFIQYKKTGFLGCPYCYTHFKEILYPTIKRIQFNLQHDGKSPLHTSGEEENRKKLAVLKKELNRAVAVEDFEKALDLRDKIKLIESKKDE